MHFLFLTKELKGSVNTFYLSLNIKFSRFPVHRTGLRLVYIYIYIIKAFNFLLTSSKIDI